MALPWSFGHPPLIVAAATPMRDGGRALDEDAIGPMVAFLEGHGADGVFCCGTTGEGILLETDERRAATRAFRAATRGQLLVHAGAQTTAETVHPGGRRGRSRRRWGRGHPAALLPARSRRPGRSPGRRGIGLRPAAVLHLRLHAPQRVPLAGRRSSPRSPSAPRTWSASRSPNRRWRTWRRTSSWASRSWWAPNRSSSPPSPPGRWGRSAAWRLRSPTRSVPSSTVPGRMGKPVSRPSAGRWRRSPSWHRSSTSSADARCPSCPMFDAPLRPLTSAEIGILDAALEALGALEPSAV